MNVILQLMSKVFEETASAREAKIIAKIVGVRWDEKNAGRASGQWAEAYFFLDFSPTFSAMEKVRERNCCVIEITRIVQTQLTSP